MRFRTAEGALTDAASAGGPAGGSSGSGPRRPPGGLGVTRARLRAGPGEGLRGGAAARGERGRPGSARSAARRAVALRRRRPRPAGAEEGPETGATGGSCLRDDCRQRGGLRRPSRGPRRRCLSWLSPSPPLAAGASGMGPSRRGPRTLRRP
ncbi:translation initiation factor IF-2-like [Zalophus californianus]|uniref:Translation initiation factor IF-2-like n=1 Tax=Zalophus californianus TaxID=9704 RepID=A0A6J2BQ91_ZALCA|nr:translation initiation factor IF-2-like [Zalophus californianus]